MLNLLIASLHLLALAQPQALEADAKLYTRVTDDVVRAAIGGGIAGVRLQMERLGTVLKQAMLMTGCADLAAIGPGVLYK